MKAKIIPRRRAFTVTELVVALALLATAIGLSSTLLTRMVTARGVSQARLRAYSAAENVLEVASARSWDQLSPGPLELPRAAEDVAAVVPDGQLEIQVVDVLEGVPSRRIDVTVRGALPSGAAAPVVRLSTWVFEHAPPTAEVEP